MSALAHFDRFAISAFLLAVVSPGMRPVNIFRDDAQATCGAGGVIPINGWYARVGNNLGQLRNAIILAKVTRTPRVRVPQKDGTLEPTDVGKIFTLPEELLVDVEEEDSWWSQMYECPCMPIEANFRNPCKVRDSVDPVAALNEASRKAMTEVILPLAHPEFLGCSAPSKATLTIHGRYGDVGAFRPHEFGKFAQEQLYPCAFYNTLIDTFKFTRVVFVAEDRDRDEHPCIEALRNRKDITLDVDTSLEGAVCNFVMATNLVVPLSTFSKIFMYGNLQSPRVFTTNVKSVFQSLEASSCEAGVPEVYEYDIEDFTEVHTKQAKIDYMTNPHLKITPTPKRCLF